MSSTQNPENLIYTVTAGNAGLYYLRVDLNSIIPTLYTFKISINGSQVQSYTDTVIGVPYGRTVQQFEISTACDVRITYDGPIYNIYLFAPGVDIVSGTPTSSNTTSITPKTLTQLLSLSGKYNIVIHHGITSTTNLTNFKIIV